MDLPRNLQLRRGDPFADRVAQIVDGLESIVESVRGLQEIHVQSPSRSAKVQTPKFFGHTDAGNSPDEATNVQSKLTDVGQHHLSAPVALPPSAPGVTTPKTSPRSHKYNNTGPRPNPPRTPRQPLEDEEGEPMLPTPTVLKADSMRSDEDNEARTSLLSLEPIAYSSAGHVNSSEQKGSTSVNEYINAYEMLCLWSDVDEQLVVDFLEKARNRVPEFLGSGSSMASLSPHMMLRDRRGTWLKDYSLSSVGTESPPYSWVISPLSTQRFVWDVATIIFLLDDTLMVPLQVFKLPESLVIQLVEYTCRIFWMLDIIMSLRTSFYHGFTLEQRASVIAKNYLKTWFCPEFLLIVVQWLEVLRDEHVVFDAIQLLRLLRLIRLLYLKQTVLERSHSNHLHLYLDSVQILVISLVALHLLTCGWYWLGQRDGGWVGKSQEAKIRGADLLHSYFASCRWAIAQVSGRTDLEARTSAEYIYTCFACIFGLILMSVLISSITNTMIELGALQREHLSQLRALNAYLDRNRVSAASALHAKTSMIAHQKIHINVDKELEVLALLPRQISADIRYEIYEPLIIQHQLFADFSVDLPRMLRSLCADAFKAFTAQEDEVTFARGDACTRMLFVSSGTLSYEWKKRVHRAGERRTSKYHAPEPPHAPQPVVKIYSRRWLSEGALWVEWENQGELKAARLSSLLALEVHDFALIVKKFRDATARCVVYAKEFVRLLSQAEYKSDVMDSIRAYIFFEEQELVLQTRGFMDNTPL